MSRESAKAKYTRLPGDPEVGYISPDDVMDAIDIMYDDLVSSPVVDASVAADADIDPTKIAGTAMVKTQAQTAEGVVWEVLQVTPVTPDFAPLSLRMNSGENQGAGADTYNHAAFLGFNTGRHASGSVVAAAPASFIGIEDNFFDHVGDLEFGGEFYWEVHPKGANDTFRPLYARASISTDGTTLRRAAIIADIGSDGDGQFTVREQTKAGEFTPKFNVTRDSIVAYAFTQIQGVFEVHEGAGAANLLVNGHTGANIDFRIDGVSKAWFTANAINMAIGSGAYYLATFTPGAATAALADFATKVKAQGGLWAGSATATPTATATAALGTSPPAITVVGNKVRGSVTFGTGGVSGLGNGGLMNIALGNTYAGEPINVVLTAANAATAALGLYVFPMYNAFAICVLNTPAADQANTTYSVNYQVIG